MTAYKNVPGVFTSSCTDQESSQRAKEAKARYKQFLQLIEARRRERNQAYWKKRRLQSSKVDSIAKSQARRLDALEEKIGSPNPEKH